MTDLPRTHETITTPIPGIESESDYHPRNLHRWVVGVVVGMFLGAPAGWLLSNLVHLPFPWGPTVGPFIFALFGLLIGAVVYRVAAPCRPFPRTRIRQGIFVVVGVCFGCSLLGEAVRFPTDVAQEVLSSIPVLPEGVSAHAFQVDRAEFVRGRLREVAWPGGVAGYFRWTLASSRLEVDVEGRSRPVIYRAPMYRWWWLLRAIASLSLLTFGIASQLVPLGPPREDVPDSPEEVS